MIRARQATIADWTQLVALDQAIFGGYGAQEDPQTIWGRLTVFPAGCVVLEEAGTGGTTPKASSPSILGYLTTEKWTSLREPALDEDPHHTHDATGRVLNITTLAVAPDQQNRGLGGRLIEQVMQIAMREGCTTIVLETAHAESFYRRHGFTKVGERRQRTILLHIMQLQL